MLPQPVQYFVGTHAEKLGIPTSKDRLSSSSRITTGFLTAHWCTMKDRFLEFGGRLMFKVGIMGAGKIAQKMAATLNGMDDAHAYAVASRDLDRAQGFAGEHRVEKAYGSYEKMLLDTAVDLVYIATPHSHPFRTYQSVS